MLREIARKLGKKDWEFGREPCSGEGNWKVLSGWKGSESSVTCDCSFHNNTSCHILTMYCFFHSLPPSPCLSSSSSSSALVCLSLFQVSFSFFFLGVLIFSDCEYIRINRSLDLCNV